MRHLEQASPAASIEMRQTFRARIDDVWAALTDPSHVALWYGGAGFSNPHCAMDVRPGGRWSHVMRTPEGVEHDLEFVFTDVAPPALLAWRDMRDAQAPVNIVRLETVGDDETLLSFSAEFTTAQARSAAQNYGFESILGEGFERMAKVLSVFRGHGRRA